MAAKLKMEEELAPLKELFQHHIDSYDYLIEAGLNEVTANIKPIRVFDPIAESKSLLFARKGLINLVLNYVFSEGLLFMSSLTCCVLYLGKVEVLRPRTEGGVSRSRFLYPYQCQQMHTSYTVRLMIDVNIEYKKKEPMTVIEKMPFGDFPVMVKSKSCNLRDTSVHELISRNEDSREMGGYFILKGIERVV
ncbi:hypothetical protein Droror1_Dr00018906 [Drosera rotundifolia]